MELDFGIAHSELTDVCCPLLNSGKPVKLSWPRDGDRRRAMVGKAPSREAIARIPPTYSPHIIHVTDRDMARHYILPGSPALEKAREAIQPPMPINRMYQITEESELFKYFQDVASRALPTFGIDPRKLGWALVRIASLNKSSTSHALVKLMMSFACLHKYGLHAQMMNLKIEALHDLSKTSSLDLDPVAAIQHLAAGMLLCSIEIHRASCTTGQWLIYLFGAKNIARSGNLPEAQPGTDLAMLMDWMYYYDVLARFSFQHWYGSYTDERNPKVTIFDPGALRAERPSSATASMALIGLLGEVADATALGLPDAASRTDRETHMNFLKILDWRIQNSSVASAEQELDTATLQNMELFKMAMLVYLNRANEYILGNSRRTQKLIEQGFNTLANVPFCDRQFPILIFGCEARSDEQRTAILDVMSRTAKAVPSRAFNYTKLLLQALWSQDDLADGPLEYWQKICQVMKRCTNLPTFV